VKELALVQFNPAAAVAVRNVLRSAAAMQVTTPVRVATEDLITWGTRVAQLRDRAVAGGPVRYAVPYGDGGLVESPSTYSEAQRQTVLAGLGGATAYPIVGNAPLMSGDPWARTLALASDNVLRRVAKAPSSSNEGPSLTYQTASPVIVGIIVAGAAVAVVGGVVAWRALDPETVRHQADLDAALQAYDARLTHKEATGTMPEPSPVEQAVEKSIVTLAAEGKRRSWLLSLGVVGGFTVGVTGLAWIRGEL